MATKETYRVRKNWGDPKSQLGAYSILNNAIKTCNKGGSEYKVYNSKGEVVYPKEKEEVKIDVSKEEKKIPTTSTIEIPKEGVNGKMKYSESNMPLRCLMTQSTCYKGTRIMDVKGILWHSTGANNPTLKRYVQPDDKAKDKDSWIKLLGKNNNGNDMNHINREMGVNAWIGELANGTITTVQVLPWNYRPWGCASGPKGSCNNGWIQFEICEDGLDNKNYFNAIYKEACELTAYLCKLFNLDPNGIADCNGVKTPVILCHADSYNLGLGSNHGDVYHWFDKYGKTMEDVREDVAKLMGKITNTNKIEEIPKELYKVRKDWENEKSQIGAYTNLQNAKDACDKAGEGYEVYDSEGTSIYPEVIKEEIEIEFKVGDEVRLTSNATYTNGKSIPKWVFEKKLYIREIDSKTNNVVISTVALGAITGVVNVKFLTKYDGKSAVTENFEPYLIKVATSTLNVRSGPSTSYKITTQIRKNQVYTIIGEDDGWGKLKSGAGWIKLEYTRKLG